MASSPATAQDSGKFTVAFVDTQLSTVAEIVARVAQRDIVVDPAVAETSVTLEAREALSRDELWELFVATTEAIDLEVIEYGDDAWRVVPKSAPPEAGLR